MKEHTQVIKEIIRVANKRIPIIAGTGANSTREDRTDPRSQTLVQMLLFWLHLIIINRLKKAYISTIKPLLKLLILPKFYITFLVVQVSICE
jgi:hypothetical protein